jgi:hypothetical protein
MNDKLKELIDYVASQGYTITAKDIRCEVEKLTQADGIGMSEQELRGQYRFWQAQAQMNLEQAANAEARAEAAEAKLADADAKWRRALAERGEYHGQLLKLENQVAAFRTAFRELMGGCNAE